MAVAVDDLGLVELHGVRNAVEPVADLNGVRGSVGRGGSVADGDRAVLVAGEGEAGGGADGGIVGAGREIAAGLEADAGVVVSRGDVGAGCVADEGAGAGGVGRGEGPDDGCA